MSPFIVRVLPRNLLRIMQLFGQFFWFFRDSPTLFNIIWDSFWLLFINTWLYQYLSDNHSFQRIPCYHIIRFFSLLTPSFSFLASFFAQHFLLFFLLLRNFCFSPFLFFIPIDSLLLSSMMANCLNDSCWIIHIIFPVFLSIITIIIFLVTMILVCLHLLCGSVSRESRL